MLDFTKGRILQKGGDLHHILRVGPFLRDLLPRLCGGDTSCCFDAATWKPVTPICDDAGPFFSPPNEELDN